MIAIIRALIEQVAPLMLQRQTANDPPGSGASRLIPPVCRSSAAPFVDGVAVPTRLLPRVNTGNGWQRNRQRLFQPRTVRIQPGMPRPICRPWLALVVKSRTTVPGSRNSAASQDASISSAAGAAGRLAASAAAFAKVRRSQTAPGLPFPSPFCANTRAGYRRADTIIIH